MKNRLVIYKEITNKARTPFRIAEVFQTIDGYRTRITNHSFDTYEEAKSFILETEATQEEI